MDNLVIEEEEIKPCPFCGEIPKLPSGKGSQYEIYCDCGSAQSCVQICDLMTKEERHSDPFTDYKHKDEYVERAKKEVIKKWNKRFYKIEEMTHG